MNNKIITSLFVFCLFLIFTACKDEIKYDPAEMPANAQVYFPNTLASEVELAKDLTVTSFDIPVRRIDKTADLTVNLTVVNENPDVFISVPTSVSFAAGSDIAKITITYNSNELIDTYLPLSISIDGSQTSPYGNAVYAFTAGISAWEKIGMASFMDTWLFDNSYSVELQQNTVDPTRYRLVDPYTEGLEKEEYYPNDCKGNQSPYLEFKILFAGDVYSAVKFSDGSSEDISITVDGLVVYPDFYTGWYYGALESEVYCLHPSRYLSSPTEDFWLHNIVTQFSADGKPEIVQLAPYYRLDPDGRGWDNRQEDGIITIVFPGVDMTEYDYSAAIEEYKGRLTDPSGDDFAVVKVKLGEDVAYAKVALVPGAFSMDAVFDIIDGVIESITIEAGGTVRIPCSETGTYTCYVISFDANDEPQEFDYKTFDFFSSAGGGAEKVTIEDFYGDYTFTGKSIYGDPDAEFPVTISAGEAPNTLTITGWKIEWIEDYGLEYTTSVAATFDTETGFISIAPQQLEDFYFEPEDVWIEMFLYAYDFDGDEVSETDEMTFYRMLNGQLTLTPSSEATGYIILDEDDDDWEGHYNLSFIPSPSGKSVVKKKSVASMSMQEIKTKVKSRNISKASIVKEVKSSKSDFSIQPKFSLRKARFNKMSATPIQ